MKPLRPSTAFKKDLKRLAKRGYDLSLLEKVLAKLQAGERLPFSNRPHPLKGEWQGYWDCHIRPDWVLIYKTSATEVRLARTGTHSDLFKA
ncbi:MAG: type II toxin-antitoxin system YafQ family toxin [Rhizobiales bacterium]|nr:type II toxin-antitoxin system YafQ family toxin [Hyphomicrobiales bacterium]